MTEVTRREFVATTMKTSLAVGFALAVQPVSAQTIHTDSNGLAVGRNPDPDDGWAPFQATRPCPASGQGYFRSS